MTPTPDVLFSLAILDGILLLAAYLTYREIRDLLKEHDQLASDQH